MHGTHLSRVKFFGTIGLVIIGFWAFAQPIPVVQLPEKVCKNETFQTFNTSTGATQYFWEFAYGGLQTTPASLNLGVTAATNAPDGMTLQYEAGNYIGFVVSVNSNNLVRLDFGSSLTNNPTRTDVGSLGGLLSRPRGIAIISYNNNWHGLVTNFNPAIGTASVVRLDFGNSLSNTPVAIDLGTFSGRITQPQAVQWVTDQGDLIALIGDRSQRKILMINFEQDPTASTFEFTEINFSGSGFFRDFSIVRGEDRWYGLAVFENGGIHKINFTSLLFNTPQTIELTADLPTFTTPSNVIFLRDVDRFVAIVSEYGGVLKNLDFGKNPASNLPGYQSFGNLGSLNNLQGLTFSKTNTGWIGFTHNIATSWLHRITFTGTSDATLTVSRQQEPSLSYAAAGTKYVSMQVSDARGETRFVTDSILVKMDPEADFSFTLNCTGQNTMFQDESVTQGTLSWTWNFNDPASGSTISTAQNPTHQFTAATNYTVELTVTDDCGNTDQSTQVVSVNNAATTTLGITAESSICSHQEKLYSLVSNATPIEEVVWDFGNGEIVEADAPAFVYTGPGGFIITANAVVNQCIKQATQLMDVKRGAQVLFDYSSQCEDTPTAFTHQLTDGDIVEYRWTFPSGDVVEENPVYTFATTGLFNVTLHVENSLGCETMLTKNINMYSQPQVNFAVLPPPFSCSGTPAEFSDLTPPPGDSNLSTWMWNFGDTGSSSNTSSQQDPQHTYASAADYSVSLTVTTNFLCSNTIQKTITIHQSPTAAFNYSALCEDAEITFSDVASTNQAWSWQIGSSFYVTENAEHIFNNPGEYEVILSVTGANNCMATTQQTVAIPTKLTVDFSSLRTCADQNTVFTNVTDDTTDPITDFNWDFGGSGSAITNPAIVVFPEPGTVHVTLTVATESGCEYPMTKPIVITPGPLAAFTANPNMGEAPLTIQFENNSLAANAFAWDFGDGSTTSALASPFNTYEVSGYYTVQLIAQDLQSCIDTTRQIITVLSPSEVNPPSPNPSSGAFTIEWEANEETKTQLVLVDAMGRVMRTFEVLANAGVNQYVLDITGEQAGLYILTIRYSNTVKTYRLMVAE